MQATHQEQIAERLPWHSPQVLRLDVTLDTRAPGGSGADGELGDVFDAAGA